MIKAHVKMRFPRMWRSSFCVLPQGLALGVGAGAKNTTAAHCHPANLPFGALPAAINPPSTADAIPHAIDIFEDYQIKQTGTDIEYTSGRSPTKKDPPHDPSPLFRPLLRR